MMEGLSSLYGVRKETRPRAAELLEEAIKACIANPKVGLHHAETCQHAANLARMYSGMGRHAEASTLLEQYLPIQEELLDANDGKLLLNKAMLARTYEEQGRHADAIPWREVVRARIKERPTLQPFWIAMNLYKLAFDYVKVGKIEEALKVYREVPPYFLMGNAPDMEKARGELLSALKAAGRPGELARVAADVIAAAIASQEPDEQLTIALTASLVDAHLEAGHVDLAASVEDEFLEKRRTAGGDGEAVAFALARFGMVEIDRGRFAEAVRHLRECLTIRQARTPDNWMTFQAQSLLGEALWRSGDRVEAGPLLRSGYLGLKARGETIHGTYPPAIARASDRLIAFGEATGLIEDLAAFKAERARAPGIPSAAAKKAK